MAFDDTEFEPSTEFYKRKFVRDLQPTDEFVMLTGYAHNVNASDEFFLDDTTGKIHIRDIPDEAAAIKEGKLYRVLGQMTLDGAGTQYVSTKFIKDLEGLNFELFKNTVHLMKKIP